MSIIIGSSFESGRYEGMINGLNSQLGLLLESLKESHHRCNVLEQENGRLSLKLKHATNHLDQVAAFCCSQGLVLDPQTIEKPNYFDVMRPFGKGGYENVMKRFDYGPTISENEREHASLLHDSRDSLDISFLPHPYMARFITLLDSAGLRKLSYTNKYFYVECISLRGLEVQILAGTLYKTYVNMRPKPNVSILENGRLILRLAPSELAKFMPYLNITAVLYEQELAHSNFPRVSQNYSRLFCVFEDCNKLENLDVFLHDKLVSVELQSLKPFQEARRLLKVTSYLQKIESESLSLLVFVNGTYFLEWIKASLVRHAHPRVKNLFFGFSREPPLPHGNSHSISVYDQEQAQWILQVIPDFPAIPESGTRSFENVIIPN